MTKNESKEPTVFWPDVTRFGARLSVAYNPSLGANLLKLSILDEAKMVAEAGLPAGTDYLALTRELGFAVDHAEPARVALGFRLERALEGTLDEAAELECFRLERQVVFYSPVVAVNRGMLSRLFPAIQDSDLREMPVKEVKHVDSRAMAPEVAEQFFPLQAAFGGGERGVLFTTPADRDWLKILDGKIRSVVDVLLRKGPDADSPDDAVAVLRDMFPTELTGRLLHRGATLQNGEALRAIRPAAAVIGYVSMGDAVAANGGRGEGIERLELPHGAPLAIDVLKRRVLVAKDGRFLDYCHSRWGALPFDDVREIKAPAVAFRLVDALEDVRHRWQTLRDAGALERSRWSLESLEQWVPQLEELPSGLSQVAQDAGFVKWSAVSPRVVAGCLQGDVVRLQRVLGEEFCAFLGEYEDLAREGRQLLEQLRVDRAAAQGVEEAVSVVERRRADPRQRREDAGEKIGGARKDYARRWLAPAEVEHMTPTEWKDLVSKDNVWPPLDYKAMQEAGVAPQVAWMIRELRGGLPTNPYRGGYNVRRNSLDRRALKDLTQAQCENFVRAVALVRDRLTDVCTFDEFKQAVVAIREAGGVGICVSDGKYGRALAANWEADQWFSDGAGYAFCCRTLPDVYIDKDGNLDPWSFDRIQALARAKTDDEWAWAIKEKGTRAKPSGEKEKKPEPEYEHLENIDRIGPDYRQGKDIDEQSLMDVFAFRAVEYGRWLPQAERQQVLNHAFDAFMDLAAVMKLPPRAIGLGGALAVAFGSRGTGGRNAARAHFEPGRMVINLTRLSGAGCVAHEWGHAFDLVLAKAVGASQMRYLSEFHDRRMNQRVPVVEGFFRVMKASMVRNMSKEEVLAIQATVKSGDQVQPHVVDYSMQCMRSWLAGFNYRLPEALQAGPFRDFGEQLLERHFQPTEDPELAAAGLKRFVDPEGFVDAVKAFVAGHIPASHRVDEAYPRRVADYLARVNGKLYNTLKSFVPGQHVGDTRMLADAKHYDSFRSKPYWSTPVEMFARSFEAWVQDKAEAEPGHLSQYLVHGRKPSEAKEHSGWPRGADREQIAEALDAFFADNRAQLLKLLKLETAMAQECEVALA